MNSKPKISVLVPVYNVEKYLPKCLKSLISQTLNDIEIICINDGSTDSSLKILNEYKKKDKRIKIINKKNTGYGDSMNRGLEKAKGEYIGILESDDYLDIKALEHLYILASNNKADVARANYYHHLNNHDIKQLVVPPSRTRKIYNPTRDHYMLLQPPAIWSGIYRRQFLEENDIRFLPTPGASYQDTSFHFKVWSVAKRVILTDEAFLHYRLDNESSSVNSSGKIYCVCDEYNEIENYLKRKKIMKHLEGTFQCSKINAYLWNINRLPPTQAKQFIGYMRNEYRDIHLEREYFTTKQWYMLQIIRKFPPIVFYTLYKIRHLI